jgi:hypothetical protein
MCVPLVPGQTRQRDSFQYFTKYPDFLPYMDTTFRRILCPFSSDSPWTMEYGSLESQYLFFFVIPSSSKERLLLKPGSQGRPKMKQNNGHEAMMGVNHEHFFLNH